MGPESIAPIVAHAGHETGVPVGQRLAIGALAGLFAVALVSPWLVLSERLRGAAAAAVGDLLVVDAADLSRSASVAILLAGGLVLGSVFEVVVLWFERVRPVMIVVGGRVAVADLLAVVVVASLIAWPARRSIRLRPEAFTRGDAVRAAAASLAYGVILLVVVSTLHSYLAAPT